jgi:hypothetical protein
VLVFRAEKRNNCNVPAGRPSKYTPELADLICDMIAEGQSIRSICQTAGFPDRTTIRNWLEKNPEFSAKCARAWELQADWYADRQAELAEDTILGNVDASAAKVAMSAWQWLASKRAPKRYGDTQNINQRLVDEQGRDREPLTVVFVGLCPASAGGPAPACAAGGIGMSPAEIALRVAFTSFALLVALALAIKYAMGEAFCESHPRLTMWTALALVALCSVTFIAILGAVWMS